MPGPDHLQRAFLLDVRVVRHADPPGYLCSLCASAGQLAPFTFSRNEEANMVAELLRDFNQAKAKRGLRFSAAGSINNGSRLTGMRLLMAAIQRHGRYVA